MTEPGTMRATDLDVRRILAGSIKIESIIHCVFSVDGIRYEYKRVDPAYRVDGDPYQIPK